jgi:hypothetical protein
MTIQQRQTDEHLSRDPIEPAKPAKVAPFRSAARTNVHRSRPTQCHPVREHNELSNGCGAHHEHNGHENGSDPVSRCWSEP